MSKPSNSQRVYGGTSAEERQRVRKEAFLNAGLVIIGTQGYKAATVRTICQQAELTQRYFYESFENMEDLLIQVYQSQWQMIATIVMTEAQTQNSPIEIVKTAIYSFFTTIKTHPNAARVLFFEILGVSPAVDATYQDGGQRFEQVILGFAKPLIEASTSAQINAELISTAIGGAFGELARKWLLNDFNYSVEEITQSVIGMLELNLDLK